MKILKNIFLSLVIVVLLTGSVSAAVTQSAEKIQPTEELTEDAYFAGTTIAMNVPVRGELFMAGQDVDVKNTLERSIFLAASKANFAGKVSYNAYIAAGDVVISGEVGQDAFIFANTVVLTDTAHVYGNIKIFASKVTLGGKVDGDVTIGAATVTSSADIMGNMKVAATQLSFTKGSVGGSVEYQSQDAVEGRDLVSIKGNFEFIQSDGESYAGGVFANFLSLLLFGLFILIFLARQARMVVSVAYSESWAKNYLTGLVTFFGLPILSMLFFVTVLGWRVGLLLLASYAVAMLIAGTFSAVLLGKYVATRVPSLAKVSQRKNLDLFISLIIGLVILLLVSMIPVIGVGIAAFISFFFLFIPVVGTLTRMTISQQHNQL